MPHASVPPGPWSPDRTSRPPVPYETSGTVPTRLWAPTLGRRAGHAAHIPLLSAPTYDAESFVSSGFPPPRPPSRVLRIKERGHRLTEVPQGLLLHHLG